VLPAGHRRVGAVVEDRVRTDKAMGLGNLPASTWDHNRAWVLAANIAADLGAWHRLLCHHDRPDLVRAEPKTIRRRVYCAPATLAHHARRRFLRFDRTWPWTQAITDAWLRICALPDPKPG